MPELLGLPGVKRRAVVAQTARNRTSVLRLLRTNRAVTAAGDCGALNVWRDDDGSVRAEFYRHMVAQDSVQCLTYDALRRWLRRWWPRLHSVSNG